MQELIINSAEIPKDYFDVNVPYYTPEYNGRGMDLVKPISGIRQVAIKRVNWPKTWMNIDWWNNEFAFMDDGGNVVVATLSKGNYTAQSLATELQSRMNVADPLSAWSVGYNDSTKRFIFSKASVNTISEFYFANGDSVYYLMYVVGWGPQNVWFADIQTLQVAPYIADLSMGINNIYLTIDEFETQDFVNLNVQNQPNTIIATMPVPQESGLHVNYEPEHLTPVEFDIPFMVRKLTPTFWVMIGLDLIPVRLEGANYEIVLYYETKGSRKEQNNRSGRF